MKLNALSLRQPWAWLVLHGGKDIENRVWNTRLRGPILLHAAKGMTCDEYLDVVEFARSTAEFMDEPAPSLPPFSEVLRGGVVGATSITGVLPPVGVGRDAQHPWHIAEQFGFLLGRRVELPFRPLKGSLGFFDVELTDDEERVLRMEGLIK